MMPNLSYVAQGNRQLQRGQTDNWVEIECKQPLIWCHVAVGVLGDSFSAGEYSLEVTIFTRVLQVWVVRAKGYTDKRNLVNLVAIDQPLTSFRIGFRVVGPRL